MAISNTPGWGTAGPTYLEGNSYGDNEINRVGEGGVIINGRQFVRMGPRDLAYLQPYAGPGDIINDPIYGQLVAVEVGQRFAAANDTFSDNSAAVWGLAAAGLGAFVAPAIAGAGAASAGGTGAAAAGSMSAADLAGLYAMGADAGLSGAALEAFVASGGTMGSAAAGGAGALTGVSDYLSSPEFLADFEFGSVTPQEISSAIQEAGMSTSQANSIASELSKLSPDQLKSINWGSVDWGKLLAAGGSIIGNLTGPNASDFTRIAQGADPFASQRGYYQQQLPGMLQRYNAQSNAWRKQNNRFMRNWRNEYNDFQDSYDQQYNKFQRGYDNRYDSFLRGYNREYNQFQQGFQGEYDKYTGVLDQMFNDPDYWANDSLLAGLNENALNDASRSLAARGYNMSGNEAAELSELLQNNNAQYAGQQQQNYTNYANMGLSNYANAGLGALNSYGTNRLGALNSYGDFAGQSLNNFSNTGLASLNNFSTTGLNNSSNYLNYLNNQLGLFNSVGNLAGANVSDPSRAAYLSMMGMQNNQSQWNDMWGNAGVLLGQFFGNPSTATKSALS